jgi:hypothetical protein
MIMSSQKLEMAGQILTDRIEIGQIADTTAQSSVETDSKVTESHRPCPVAEPPSSTQFLSGEGRDDLLVGREAESPWTGDQLRHIANTALRSPDPRFGTWSNF